MAKALKILGTIYLVIFLIIAMIPLLLFIGVIHIDLDPFPDSEEEDDPLWSREFDEEVSFSHYVYPYMLPKFPPNIGSNFSVIIDPIMTYTDSGQIHGLNFTNGESMWERDFSEPFMQPPRVWEEGLYIFLTSRIICLDPMNGTDIWSANVTELSPIAACYYDGSLFVIDEGKTIISFLPNGTLNWTFDTRVFVSNNIRVTHNYLIFDDNHDRIHCFNMSTANINEENDLILDRLWIVDQPSQGIRFGRDISWNTIINSYDITDLVMTWEGRNLVALNASSGEEAWNYSTKSDIIHGPSLFMSAGESLHPQIETIYVLTTDKSVTCLFPSGKEQWNLTMEDKIVNPLRLSSSSSSPTKYPYVFITSETGIHVLEGHSGMAVSNLTIQNRIRSISLSDEQVTISTGTKVMSYHNDYASPRDYSGERERSMDTPPMAIIVCTVLHVVVLKHVMKKRNTN